MFFLNLWDRCGLYIPKDSLIFPFSPSAFHFLSSAGQQVGRFDNQFKVMCLASHPSGPEMFLCGGYSSVVKAWDSRCGKVNSSTSSEMLYWHCVTNFYLAFNEWKAARLSAHLSSRQSTSTDRMHRHNHVTTYLRKNYRWSPHFKAKFNSLLFPLKLQPDIVAKGYEIILFSFWLCALTLIFLPSAKQAEGKSPFSAGFLNEYSFCQ